MSNAIKTLGVSWRLYFVFLLWISLLSMVAGCSTYSSMEKKAKRMVRDFRAPDSDLKKRIAIIPFENRTTFKGDALEQIFMKDLTQGIQSSCPDILLEKPGDPDYPDSLEKLPRETSGDINNFELAKIGRRLGLSAIVTGALNDIRYIKKKKGILWFKDTLHYIHVQVMTAMYDTETGAKLLDESFMHEVEIDEADLESTGAESEIITYIKNEAFKHIVDNMSERICSTIVLSPWRGYITAINAGKIVISAGKRAGLVPGDIFEVYNCTETFQGAGGHRFFIPGLKTGEIKITEVYPDTAEAIRISGSDIRVGFSIRLED